ncbi:uncharacterized protein LOC127716336 [Mytilus californianus]|uniref:uncharacterized protein LOC127716336 n=1 Tax=Mytilus californianus TaxID=6549 RepID=UPI0022478B7E|nr:uncharacterized protein LOC127716336 [Mytilus californianus]
MDTDDVNPGFTLLRVNNTFGLSPNLVQLNGKYYLSSALVRQEQVISDKTLSIHGPCISDQNGLIDVASCLHCKTWVSTATKWTTRPSNQWPSHNVKQRIIEHGVLFVPIGVKGSPNEDLQWRISFSVGEKLLINTFTHTQLICYALLKILLKDVVATDSECKDLLCSYFLKTIIFWISEELPQCAWKPNSLIPCFMRCLRRLIYCVKYSVCLHYFIPDNNMFENKIEGRARDILYEKLFTLHSYGWRCLLFSDQISKFHQSMPNFHIEPHSLYVPEVVTIVNSSQLQSANNLVTSMMKIRGKKCKISKKIVSCQKSSIKYLYTYFMSIACSIRAQTLPLTSTCSNKYQYTQYRSCLSTLQQNIYHDAVSGWLMLASFFYKTKQYNKALRIIEYSISKYTPAKLFRSMDVLDIDHRILKLKTIQKKSIVQQWKIMLVDVMIFEQNSLLIPYELLREVENDMCSIQTIQYAYFLKFRCHYHLNNAGQCQDSL